jgi:hypothetical protein
MTIVARYILSILENKKTLENTEGSIKNGQSRETENIGYTRQRKIQCNMCGHLM